jgi:predicted nucleotidyltransferase
MVRSAFAHIVQSRLRQALVSAYGDRLMRAVLFGSRERGDAPLDSDYDVAVFLHRPEGLWAESGRLAHIAADILDETGAVVKALPFPTGAFETRTPLMHELRRDGVDL